MMVNVEGRAVNEIEAEEADALAMAISKWEVVYSCRKDSRALLAGQSAVMVQCRACMGASS